MIQELIEHETDLARKDSVENLEYIQALVRCPSCLASEMRTDETVADLACVACGKRYPMSHGRPVLLRPDNELFHQFDYCEAELPSAGRTSWRWRNLVPAPSVNLARRTALKRIRELLGEVTSPVLLVVGGGDQRISLDEGLGSEDRIAILYTDIDVRADVDLFCDGHDLPFVDGSFDAVVTTAVLEHVLYPERVAQEITRVLKIGGVLYSELPFMQQVHEGAYDFTRFTLSGHRRLFNYISEIKSGLVAGPATALVWGIENFVLAFISRRRIRGLAKGIVRLLFGWMKYFDILLQNRPAAIDGASCTYLLGRKSTERVADTEIISRYSGAQELRHT